MTSTRTIDRRSSPLQRFALLAGVLAAGLAAAGNLTIDEFPEGTTDGASLRAYYAVHGPHVALGGTLLIWSAICLGIFVAGVWARARISAPPVVAGLVLLGGAVETASELDAAAVYHFLGAHGADGHIAPAALQAWQLAGTEIGTFGGLALLLLSVGVAGLGFRAVPRWLGAVALLLAVGLFTPVSFLVSLVFLLWVAVTGIVLAVRPGLAAARAVRQPVEVA